MRLEHITGMQAGCTMGLDKEGRESLVVCLKGTYGFPKNGQAPELLPEQLPLVEADQFSGEPGLSAPVYESDYAPVKPRCDILFNGSAYAPGGKPAAKVPVALQFGDMKKSFVVVGDRKWKHHLLGIKADRPIPFMQMPISYDRAFGGVDDSRRDPKKVRVVMENPVGAGYHHYLDGSSVDGMPLPNTEEYGRPVKRPNKIYRPMAFGPIGRGWQPRTPLAGTYDQNWQDNIFPFLPPDFKDDYFQAAPADQQVPHPKGGEPVILVNLTPAGRQGFIFPAISLMAWFFLKNGEEKERRLVVDTVVLEPDQDRFSVTSRTSLPLQRNMLEVELVVVARDPHEKKQIIGDQQVTFPLIDALTRETTLDGHDDAEDDDD
jgi:hypothetical protein